MAVRFKGIKTAAEYKRGELAKDILRLVAAGLVVGTMAVAAPNTVQLIEYFAPKSPRERNKIWRAIKYLESRDRLRVEEMEGKTYMYITEQGRRRFDEDAIWELVIPQPRRWDHQWRLVMFDLPSRHNNVRQAFRMKLEDFGFKLYQRSVFIYPYECRDEINAVAEWFGVKQCIRYVVATEINDMRTYVKQFDLV